MQKHTPSMTPEEEVQAMLASVDAWPDDVADDPELSVHVCASKEMTRSAVLQDALHLLLLRHPMSFMLRPTVCLIFRAVDDRVRHATCSQ